MLKKKKCIDECKKDDVYQNEFNSICYINCPNGTYANNYICIKETDIETNSDIDIDKETQNVKNSDSENPKMTIVQTNKASEIENIKESENSESEIMTIVQTNKES